MLLPESNMYHTDGHFTIFLRTIKGQVTVKTVNIGLLGLSSLYIMHKCASSMDYKKLIVPLVFILFGHGPENKTKFFLLL